MKIKLAKILRTGIVPGEAVNKGDYCGNVSHFIIIKVSVGSGICLIRIKCSKSLSSYQLNSKIRNTIINLLFIGYEAEKYTLSGD